MRGRRVMLVNVGWRRVVGLVLICTEYHRVRCGPVTDLVTPGPGWLARRAETRLCAWPASLTVRRIPVYTLL